MRLLNININDINNEWKNNIVYKVSIFILLCVIFILIIIFLHDKLLNVLEKILLPIAIAYTANKYQKIQTDILKKNQIKEKFEFKKNGLKNIIELLLYYDNGLLLFSSLLRVTKSRSVNINEKIICNTSNTYINDLFENDSLIILLIKVRFKYKKIMSELYFLTADIEDDLDNLFNKNLPQKEISIDEINNMRYLISNIIDKISGDLKSNIKEYLNDGGK